MVAKTQTLSMTRGMGDGGWVGWGQAPSSVTYHVATSTSFGLLHLRLIARRQNEMFLRTPRRAQLGALRRKGAGGEMGRWRVICHAAGPSTRRSAPGTATKPTKRSSTTPGTGGGGGCGKAPSRVTCPDATPGLRYLQLIARRPNKAQGVSREKAYADGVGRELGSWRAIYHAAGPCTRLPLLWTLPVCLTFNHPNRLRMRGQAVAVLGKSKVVGAGSPDDLLRPICHTAGQAQCSRPPLPATRRPWSGMTTFVRR